jgi:hypothetical protein
MPLCRPEGMLLCLAGLGSLVVAHLVNNKTWMVTLKQIVWSLVCCLGSIPFLLFCRILYFGVPFPNTYYAKVDSDRNFNFREGWKYLTGFWQNYEVVGLLAILLAASAVIMTCIYPFLPSSVRERSRVILIWSWTAVIVAGTAVPLWVGGDHFNWWRFLQPYWVCLLAGIMFLADRIQPSQLQPLFRVLIFSPLLILLMMYQYSGLTVSWERFSGNGGLAHEFRLAAEGRRVAADLNDIFKNYDRLPTVGSITVGGIGSRYKGPINDLMALNNVEMAHASSERKSFIKNHSAFNTDTFFKQRPAFLFLMADYCRVAMPKRMLDENGFYADSLKLVQRNPLFNELYIPIVVWNDKLEMDGAGICGYALKNEIETSGHKFKHKVF